MPVSYDTKDRIAIITIKRPQRRNAVDLKTAKDLYDAFKQFESDKSADIAILTGEGGHFCAGADLQAVSSGESLTDRVQPAGDFGPMGPTRLALSKPVIAAIEGYAVAGGLELALWCDLRVASENAKLGVFCRRFGVPLIDGGTIRLPRLIGESRAMDLILTGREVSAKEARKIGLVNRVTSNGNALKAAKELAEKILQNPQICMRHDRLSLKEQWTMTEQDALINETRLGLKTIQSGETKDGADRFKKGDGRHGKPTL